MSATVTTNPTPQSILSGSGPLSALASNPYNKATYQYPITGLGQDEAPHYILFNINLPITSKYFGNTNPQPDNVSASQQNALLLQKTAGRNAAFSGNLKQAATLNGLVTGASQVFSGTGDSIAGAFGAGVGSGLKAGLVTGGATVVAGTVAENLSIQPKLKRIVTSVAIYMPETVITQFDQSWSGESLTNALGKLGKYASIGTSGAAAAVKSTVKGAFEKNANFGDKLRYNNASSAEFAGTIAEATGQVGQGFTAFALNSVGKAINPQVEVLFQGTDNRTYVMEFDFQPRSQQEALSVFNILKMFKIYSSPEMANEGNGRYFIPPGEFDISFHFRNVENLAISRISTCVLTNLTINYNGSGPWTTFEDGYPVHIHAALTFKETDIMYRSLIEKYGY